MMRKLLERLPLLGALLFGTVSLGLAGCNTIAGAGEDIQSGGEAIERSAEEVADELDG